jgi:8-oxo-dGTP pyrophosphatase MutT (NUDIX family)
VKALITAVEAAILAGMRWEVRSERPLYTDEWLDVRIADVELPDGRHLDHRLIRTRPGAGVVLVRDGQVLLLWRHRFITDSWGYEIPLGKLDPGEDPAAGAAREFEEETGWRSGPLEYLLRVEPTPGLYDGVHHIYRAEGATHIGPPEDAHESEHIEWVPLASIPRLVGDGKITSGTTLAALLYTMTRPAAEAGN